MDLRQSHVERRIMTQQQLAKSIEKKQLTETPQQVSSSVRQRLMFRDDASQSSYKASESSSMKIPKYNIGDSPSIK